MRIVGEKDNFENDTLSFSVLSGIKNLELKLKPIPKTLLDKKSIRCACLGTALKLPMTEATFIENIIMIAMAISMLTNYTVV